MEPREAQKLNRKHSSPPGHRADKVENTMNVEEFKLQVQSNSWMRIGSIAKNKEIVFNNLYHHLNVENLRQAYHAQDGSKAVGINRITKRDYGENLEANLKVLVDRLHKGTYRPWPKRGVQIPKANGSMRPIAVGEFEDKLVEWVLNKILTTVFEPLFIPTSYGFRPRKNTLDAVKTAFCSLFQKKQECVVDIDLRSFFDTVSHRKLIKMIAKRVSDRRVLSLVARFLKAGVLWDERLEISDNGTPQGGVVSPTLANIYLHYALDTWFLENFTKQGGVISRYADDVVFTFRSEQEGKRFMTDVKNRLAFYGLQINEDKSGMILFKPRSGNIFNFVGFTFYWGTDRSSRSKRLRIKTEKKRLYKAINNFTLWIKTNRNKLKLSEIWEQAAAKLRGHYNYFGVYCNRPKLTHFYHAVIGLLFKWLNRRSQKKSYSWERFAAKLRQQPLPQPPPVVALKRLVNPIR